MLHEYPKIQFFTVGSSESNSRWITAGICFCLALLVLICYSHVRHFKFVNIDDAIYVSENRQVRSGLSIRGTIWAFTTFEAANWHPLTWLSLMIDTSIFGPGPEGYHITNVFLHITNTILLFLIFSKMTTAPGKSAILAVVFAIHPLHVESVAWISERKDVLSTFFGFLSIASYIRYANTRRWFSYGLTMIFLCLGLMSKALLVTWPCLFLLLDYWPIGRITITGGETHLWFHFRKRLWPLVTEKLLLMVPVVLISVNTLAAQRYWDAVISVGEIDVKTRIANALVSYAGYIAKAIWPVNLSVFYPYRDPETILWPAVGAFLLLILVAGLSLAIARKAPYFPVGWFWFLGTLVPMIGLVQVGDQAMADRYMYVPLIGLAIVAIWGATDLLNQFSKPVWTLIGAAVMVTVSLGAATHRQVGRWENSLTLFQHAVAINPDSTLAHNNLGAAYDQQGDLQKAEQHYRRSLALNPLNADAANNLAIRLSDSGRFDEAERLYRRATRIDPKWVSYRYNYGVLLFRLGRIEEAIEQFSEALTLNPSYAKAYNYIGSALVRQGKQQQAIAFFQRAIELDATFAPARNNLERLLQVEKGDNGFCSN